VIIASEVFLLTVTSFPRFTAVSDQSYDVNETEYRLKMAEIHDQFDTILILDFGSQVRISESAVSIARIHFGVQYSHLITRRCREHNVYAELLPCTTKIKDLHFKPKGILHRY
jgi:hypothetical protein